MDVGAVAGHKNHKMVYFKVFIGLTVLTVLELLVPEMRVSQFAKASLLSAMALTKAAMVGWSYMHLNEETKWMRFIALIPLAAFAYAFVVILESLYR